ncbi:outer membrane beta-barrel protein [Bradyrhizobium sp. 141]|uniref:outer membrane protein n=1 Tax=Bradyrhizobium sp. 141 TaxID=2782617 RepID=UPI001FF7E27B|nr:outer membrane beta-barrel protein [Bradyrhizobium sp. 141]MCK1718506.1 outer membrane beta-barrel protein [Bradyrhizobium sp. 141]
MRRFGSAGAGLFAILTTSGAASAADLAARPYTKAPAPIAAMYDWSGFYIGVNGGGGWSRNCWDIVTNILGAAVVPPVSEGCHTASGAAVGGQLGYRGQSGAWVFGLEGQGDWANLSGSNGPSLLAGGGGSDRTKIDAFGLVTGQVGYAWSNVLFYVKGGGIVASDKYEGFITATGFVFDKASETRWGGAVGAGLDFGVAPNIVVGVDYVHGFMGSRNNSFYFTGPLGAFSRTDRISQDIDIVTARVSYRFGGPLIAKY